MIILINDRGELYIMVAPGEEQAVTEAKSCSGRSAGEGQRTPALTSAYVCAYAGACVVFCLVVGEALIPGWSQGLCWAAKL